MHRQKLSLKCLLRQARFRLREQPITGTHARHTRMKQLHAPGRGWHTCTAHANEAAARTGSMCLSAGFNGIFFFGGTEPACSCTVGARLRTSGGAMLIAFGTGPGALAAGPAGDCPMACGGAGPVGCAAGRVTTARFCAATAASLAAAIGFFLAAAAPTAGVGWAVFLPNRQHAIKP